MVYRKKVDLWLEGCEKLTNGRSYFEHGYDTSDVEFKLANVPKRQYDREAEVFTMRQRLVTMLRFGGHPICERDLDLI